MRPLSRLSQAGDRLDELGLAVSVDSCDPDDLAGAHLERHAGNLFDSAVVANVDVLELEHDVPRRRRRLVDAEQHLASDHHAGEPFLGRPLARHGVDLPPSPENRDPVGDLEHLVQLVADEDDRHALALEALEDPEELRRLLRREYGCRLVEDEDVGPPVERLQDLDALLLTDRDVLDLRVGIDPEAELQRELADPRACRVVVEDHAVLRRLRSRGRCSRPPS